MSKIFISYRRDDSSDIVGRIYDRLGTRFGGENVFKDVDTIPYGSDFRDAIHDALSGCEAMLIVIGDRWMGKRRSFGPSRLDNPTDFVRLEIETALKREKRENVLVLPILVRGAAMPSPGDLPPEIENLAYLQAHVIRNDPDFNHDIELVVKSLCGVVGEAPTTDRENDCETGQLANERAPGETNSAEPGHWQIFDCLTGEIFNIAKFPFEFSPESMHPGVGPEKSQATCTLVESYGVVSLVPSKREGRVVLNGSSLRAPTALAPAEDYSLRIGSRLFLLRSPADGRGSLEYLQTDHWCIHGPHKFHADENVTVTGPIGFEDLEVEVIRNQIDREKAVAYLDGASMGFYARDILTGEFDERAANINVATGEYICPVCAERFDRADVLWIAKHPELMGDPRLGEDRMRRFHPKDFDVKGQPFDAKGVVCSETACPHCLSRFVEGFLEVPHFTISIAGAVASGKSYYLAALIHQLSNVLPKVFSLACQDADSELNEHISEMRRKVFSGSKDPEDLYLRKTDVDGETYLYSPMHSESVARPFCFLLNPFGNAEKRDDRRPIMLFCYDCAGEDFYPPLRRNNARTLAQSTALFFLFDPIASPEFREKLPEHEDPQWDLDLIRDYQERMLSKMVSRTKAELGLGVRERLPQPMAVIVGKCDIWQGLIPDNDFPRDPTATGAWSPSAVEANSADIRNLLLELVPNFVANVESRADQVAYFPVAALGHSPRMAESKFNGCTICCPVPGKISPILPEAPVLWALSIKHPELLGLSPEP